MSESIPGRHESPETARYVPEPGRHEVDGSRAEGPRPSFWADFWDAVSLRTVSLIVGVLALQIGFVLSYVGAFHHPVPRRVPLVVVAPAQASAQAVSQLNAIPGRPVAATGGASEAVARQQLRQGATGGVLVVNPTGTTDMLLVAGAGGSAKATALQQVISQAEAVQHRSVTVSDVVPVQSGDARGLTGFYLVIGWIVGGYLVASLLGIAGGARPATVRRVVLRLIAVVPYAILSGLGGTIVVDPVLGALRGHFVALWWIGALLVSASATVTMAFQVMFGVLGIGLTVLVFVVLGNPSAGGAYPPELLPPFWRAISEAIPNGAGTAAVRKIVYFGAHGIAGNLLVTAVYAVAGAVVALAVAALKERRTVGAAGGTATVTPSG
jgi:Protein of unknown function (DUF3533)